jgi:hypothetical protein
MSIVFIPVKSVKHFDGDQHGKSHCHGVRIVEDVAVDVGPFFTAASTLKVVRLENEIRREKNEQNMSKTLHRVVNKHKK